MGLTREEKDLAARIGFTEDVLLLVKKLATTQPLYGEEALDKNGTAVGVLTAYLPTLQGDEDYYQQRENLRCLRQHLQPLGYRFADVPVGRILVVLRTDNQYDLLTLMQTNLSYAAVYGKDLISKLQEWEARYGLDIEQVAKNGLYMRLHTSPSDLESFAQEVYEFCPYVVDSGTALRFDTVHELDQEALRADGYDPADFVGLIVTDKGIRLLAKAIQEEGCIGLLWPIANL